MENDKIIFSNEAEYETAMKEILSLMNKGEGNLSKTEAWKLRKMAVAAEEFEDVHYPLPKPKTIPEMVELKRFQLKLTQAALAEMLGLGKPKLSQILNGKREPDVPFLKAVYQKLGVDPGFLLDNA
ncbi:helix-turn-helix transcriptional regulator [Dyadobacter chenwenxiniae]|uniref:Helix-turn-helix transcriptional regulator n=1 Tax=Dyadobacter chenwenxiniae TaxID=2906456 RepID=A0A9X1PNP0_9BACT|nr:helix-turn-helix domain-containing protein [Dyadobacter chenwenxiniae]MCF0063359.1 helix-turn-helix transcriptional regulator [Dyadobacter chenwenxiniae]UON85262.1 helix-turn-helix transcriptional regulator [Dyadobacter chenwenxiniae]